MNSSGRHSKFAKFKAPVVNNGGVLADGETKKHFLNKMHFLLYVFSVFSICKANEFRFGLKRSTDWQFAGRKVQFTFTMDIPESTPLKAKIKLPFNGSAIMRLTEAKIVSISEHLVVSDNTTTLTSSANDSLNDKALFEFGNVTRAPSVNSTEIKIDFEVQVLNHAHIINGGALWVSIGAEYQNQSIWASQLAIRSINTAVSKPDLKLVIWPANGLNDVHDGGQAKFRLLLSHSALTTEEVVGGRIEWPLPPVLTLNMLKTVGESIQISKVVNTTEMVTIKFGQLKFPETVDLELTFDIDLHKTKADGKVHDLTTYANVKYNGSLHPCSSGSGSREFTNDGEAASIKYYVPLGSCDGALGMIDGSLANGQITASSYAIGGEPNKGRLNGANAWIPLGKLSQMKNEYLEVNFTSKVKIHRLVTEGLGKNFVRDLSLFYSNDGAIFKPYKQGSKTKVFPANKYGDDKAVIILPVPLEAVFVRVSPNAWQNSIALKVEFYGCKLNQPVTPGPLKFSGRGYYLNRASDVMYVCSMPLTGKKQSSKCFFSRDQGASWTAIDHGVISLLGHDTKEDRLYGVSADGKTVLRSTTDHSAKFFGVSMSEWNTAKAKSTTNHAVMIGNDLAITNTTLTPQAEHVITSNSGTKWGVSAKGIHVEESLVWKLKAVWMMCSSP